MSNQTVFKFKNCFKLADLFRLGLTFPDVCLNKEKKQKNSAECNILSFSANTRLNKQEERIVLMFNKGLDFLWLHNELTGPVKQTLLARFSSHSRNTILNLNFNSKYSCGCSHVNSTEST